MLACTDAHTHRHAHARACAPHKGETEWEAQHLPDRSHDMQTLPYTRLEGYGHYIVDSKVGVTAY